MKHKELEQAVLLALKQQIYLGTCFSEMSLQISKAPLLESRSIPLNRRIVSKEKELSRITRYKQSLYEDWKDGEISA